MASVNYYLLLQIFDFDNDLVGSSDDDPAVKTAIHKALTDRQREWAKDSRNPRKASKAGHDLDLSKKAEQELSTMDQRKQAWADAKNVIEKNIRRTIGIFAGKGYLLSGEVDAIIEKVGKDEGVKLDKAKVKELAPAGIEIKQEEVSQGKELKKPVSYVTYNNDTGTLKVYGYTSLYDLLGRDRGITKVKSTPTASWLQWADEDKRTLPNKATTEVADRKKLYARCTEAFANDDKRSHYDEYLAYEAVAAIFEEVKEASSVSKKLDNSIAEGYIDRIFEAGSKAGMQISRDDAGQYLLGYCAKHGILYAAPSSSNHAAGTTKISCPWCGSLVDPHAEACPNCGGRIMVACPNCGTKNRADNKFCSKCSYDYGNLALASTMCDQAKVSVNGLRFEEAEQLLTQAESLWKGFEGIPSVKSLLENQKSQIGPLADKLNHAVEAKRFNEAKQLYAEVQRRSPQFSNATLQESIASGIAGAEAQFNGSSVSNADMATLLAVFARCADYPGLAAAFAGNPPKAVSAVRVHADGKRRANVITWEPSASNDVSYILVRKQDSKPMDASDGEVLAKTLGRSFTDSGISSAKPYYYAVTAVLGPLQSGLTTSEVAENYFDVKGIKVSPSESTIQISWVGVPRNGTVEARRSNKSAPTSPRDGEKVSNIVENGLQETGLDNGVEYYYTIFVQYADSSGKTVYSSGVSCNTIPSAPPEPVKFILPQLQADGTFKVEWDQPSNGEVRFYYSVEAPKWNQTDTVAESEIASALMPLNVSGTGEGKGHFSLPDDQVYHIVSATVKNGVALIGATTTVSNKRAVTIDKIDTSGTNIVVMFSWPEDSERVLLAWRTDRFLASADEHGSAKKMVNRKLYDLNRAILVEGLDPNQTYYFSLFAQLGSGDSASFSAGSNKIFSVRKSGKAEYWVQTRGFLGRITGAKLIIESTVDVPQSELRIQKMNIPVFPTQGVVAAAIPPQPGKGTHEVEIPTSILSKGMYYRLFFTDSSEYDRIDLSLRPGTNAEIG